jgi:hypothetical protein
MKTVLRFDVTLTPMLADGLLSGLSAYATTVHGVRPPATLWLQLCDGRILRVDVEMHDLRDWEEIGTFKFEIVSAENSPEMVRLPLSWSQVREVKKLVYTSDECEAECGFTLCTSSGDQLVIAAGADVYTLAIKAPFYSLPFTPENDFTVYIKKDF